MMGRLEKIMGWEKFCQKRECVEGGEDGERGEGVSGWVKEGERPR